MAIFLMKYREPIGRVKSEPHHWSPRTDKSPSPSALISCLLGCFVPQNYKKVTKIKKKALANVGESMANIEPLPAARNVTPTMENPTLEN